MSRCMSNRWGLLFSAVTVVALGYASHVSAAEKADASEAKSSSAQSRTANKPIADEQRAPRMPAHFNKVIDAAQREKIVALLEQYGPKIQQMRAELEALTAERDEALFGVLSPQQQKQVEALRAESLAKRRATLDAKDSEEEAKAVSIETSKRARARSKARCNARAARYETPAPRSSGAGCFVVRCLDVPCFDARSHGRESPTMPPMAGDGARQCPRTPPG